MVTKEIAASLHYGAILHHVTEKNSDGSPMRVRVTGKCKVWKTRPAEFRLPVKYGLYESGAIEPWNADQWVVA